MRYFCEWYYSPMNKDEVTKQNVECSVKELSEKELFKLL